MASSLLVRGKRQRIADKALQVLALERKFSLSSISFFQTTNKMAAPVDEDGNFSSLL
jgi:hypothetical protein